MKTFVVAVLFFSVSSLAFGKESKDKKPRLPASQGRMLTCAITLDGSKGTKSDTFSKKIDSSMIAKLTSFELSYSVDGDKPTVVSLDVGIDSHGFYVANLSFPYDFKNQGYFTASSNARNGSRYISVSSNWEASGQNPILRGSADCSFE
jgi:hypothetical protein